MSDPSLHVWDPVLRRPEELPTEHLRWRCRLCGAGSYSDDAPRTDAKFWVGGEPRKCDETLAYWVMET
ncbi:MAG: hypothetical protein BWY99_00365 [Synergistetes bacterium ADurb.BinA166]|nr:MAG: hypothetical protein BWY99_00365 [Synergistetes bacterium ADurb.BinA166]